MYHFNKGTQTKGMFLMRICPHVEGEDFLIKERVSLHLQQTFRTQDLSPSCKAHFCLRKDTHPWSLQWFLNELFGAWRKLKRMHSFYNLFQLRKQPGVPTLGQASSWILVVQRYREQNAHF